MVLDCSSAMSSRTSNAYLFEFPLESDTLYSKNHNAGMFETGSSMSVDELITLLDFIASSFDLRTHNMFAEVNASECDIYHLSHMFTYNKNFEHLDCAKAVVNLLKIKTICTFIECGVPPTVPGNFIHCTELYLKTIC